MKWCVRDFSTLALKDPLLLAGLQGPAQLHRLWVLHPAHTGSQGSCPGFNFTLVYLSVQSLPSSFNPVPESLRPYIMVFISPLQSALAWWIKGNLQGKGFCCAFSSSIPPALCPPIPLLWFGCSVLSLPEACFCPSYCPDFHFPNFCRAPRREEPLLFAPCQSSLSNCWLFSSIQLCRSRAGNHLAAPCSGAVNCLPAEKRLLESCSDWCLCNLNIFWKT